MLIILKLGGNVVTDKSNTKLIVQKERIAQIVSILTNELKLNPNTKLILVHGAGSAGHPLAVAHNLRAGSGANPAKRAASITSIAQCTQITSAITSEFAQNEICTLPIHTSSIVTQTNTNFAQIYTNTISTALAQNIVPILYGSMVLDSELGFSVCSGDTVIAELAQILPIAQIYFASDVAGIYTADPHTNPDAKHIAQITFDEITSLTTNGTLGKSRHTDATDGMRGKLTPFTQFAQNQNLEKITIFDGTNPHNFYGIINNKFHAKSTIITK